MFEEAMQRLEREAFTPIRNVGRKGDWKADGVLDEGRVVYQVYSPSELGADKTRQKVNADLSGAVEHWEDVMEEWKFVYNRRVERGVDPEVVAILNEASDEHPEIEIGSLHDGDLWSRLRNELSYDERAEIVGTAPEGWDGVFIPTNPAVDEQIEGLEDARIVILQPFDHPIDRSAVMEALAPEVPFGPPYRLAPNRNGSWDEMADSQRQQINGLVDRVGDQLTRFAVFSFGPVPLAVHLGFVLSDRVDVELFQFHRDRRSWSWDPELDASDVDSDIRLSGLSDDKAEDVSEVCLRFSLSATVSDTDLEGVCPESCPVVDVSVEDPDVTWLQHPDQLAALREVCRATWREIRRRYPVVERINLFYAGPAPGAIVLGQSYNPRMNPPLAVYQYNRSNDPRYDLALVLGD